MLQAHWLTLSFALVLAIGVLSCEGCGQIGRTSFCALLVSVCLVPRVPIMPRYGLGSMSCVSYY